MGVVDDVSDFVVISVVDGTLCVGDVESIE